MALKEGQQPIEIDFTLSEAVAGTFVELEINLPVNVQDGLVFDLDQIEYRISPSFDPVAAGFVEQRVQFTFNTQAAILSWSNGQVIAGMGIQAHASAALLHSGERLAELHVDTRGRANLIARSSIFMGIDSINTTAVFNVQGRMIGSLIKVEQKALTQLVLNQLT